MKSISIEIKNMENAAFEDPEREVARILRDIADKIEAGKRPETIRDINGNRVGSMDIEEE